MMATSACALLLLAMKCHLWWVTCDISGLDPLGANFPPRSHVLVNETPPATMMMMTMVKTLMAMVMMTADGYYYLDDKLLPDWNMFCLMEGGWKVKTGVWQLQ